MKRKDLKNALTYKQSLKLLWGRGEDFEDGFGFLVKNIDRYSDQLIEEYNNPENEDIRSSIVELLGESKSSSAFLFLKNLLLQGVPENSCQRFWLLSGLWKRTKKELLLVLEDIALHELEYPDTPAETRNLWNEFKEAAYKTLGYIPSF